MTTLPDDTLRATYAREQPYRIDWPTDYRRGMADPIISRIVEMLARHSVPAYRRQDSPRWGALPGSTPAPALTRLMSGKDRAAGERDDCDLCDGIGTIHARTPTGVFSIPCHHCNGTGRK